VHPQADDDDADDADAGGAPSLSLSPLRVKMHILISPNLWLQQDATSLFQLAGRVLRSRHSPRSQWMRKND